MKLLSCKKPEGTLADGDFELVQLALEEGELVVFPTETLYGLGGDPENGKAVERIYDIKGRPRSDPLPVAVSSLEEMEKIAEVGELARTLVDEFLPGPLTLVLKKRRATSFRLISKGDTIGIRIPFQPLVVELAEEFGPITATSANLHGGENPTSVEGAIDQLGTKVDYYIDGGRVPLGVPSTVVDLSQNEIRILRVGAIPGERMESYG
ncbi:MAG: threonylcarbamoyl-AMP synthase [Thermoplasmata archaeon]|nr:threonylcarbamoyl-AMP synthase [Thermoplasmata archaeon]